MSVIYTRLISLTKYCSAPSANWHEPINILFRLRTVLVSSRKSFAMSHSRDWASRSQVVRSRGHPCVKVVHYTISLTLAPYTFILNVLIAVLLTLNRVLSHLENVEKSWNFIDKKNSGNSIYSHGKFVVNAGILIKVLSAVKFYGWAICLLEVSRIFCRRESSSSQWSPAVWFDLRSHGLHVLIECYASHKTIGDSKWCFAQHVWSLT